MYRVYEKKAVSNHAGVSAIFLALLGRTPARRPGNYERKMGQREGIITACLIFDGENFLRRRDERCVMYRAMCIVYCSIIRHR